MFPIVFLSGRFGKERKEREPIRLTEILCEPVCERIHKLDVRWRRAATQGRGCEALAQTSVTGVIHASDTSIKWSTGSVGMDG